MIKIQNENELKTLCDNNNFNVTASIAEADEFMSINGLTNCEIDGIRFNLVKPAVWDNENDCEIEPAIYRVD